MLEGRQCGRVPSVFVDKQNPVSLFHLRANKWSYAGKPQQGAGWVCRSPYSSRPRSVSGDGSPLIPPTSLSGASSDIIRTGAD